MTSFYFKNSRGSGKIQKNRQEKKRRKKNFQQKKKEKRTKRKEVILSMTISTSNLTHLPNRHDTCHVKRRRYDIHEKLTHTKKKKYFRIFLQTSLFFEVFCFFFLKCFQKKRDKTVKEKKKCEKSFDFLVFFTFVSF